MQSRMLMDVKPLTDIMPMVMRVTIVLLLSSGFLAQNLILFSRNKFYDQIHE